MADPITILGAASSAVQLADAALRLSREAYGFLCDIKDAKKDIVALRDSERLPFTSWASIDTFTALRATDSNLRSLRNYIDEFAKSKNATVEFEVLPVTIMVAIQTFQDDLGFLKDILPADLTPNLATKVRWVFDKKKIKDATRRLDRCKLDVIQATNLVGLYDLQLHRIVGQR